MAGLELRDARDGRTRKFIIDSAARRLAILLVMAVTLVTVIGGAVAQAEPTPDGIPGTWALKLNEEFTGTGVNTGLWTPGWQGTGITGPVSETCFLSENDYQPGNGFLYLQLRKHSSTCGSSPEYLGGLIESNPSDGVPGHTGFEYTYGVVEWEAYVPGVSPTGRGCPKGGCLPDWPALWSHSNTNADEIDNMEGLGTLGQACFHIHPPPGSEGPGACLSGSYAGSWHKYASAWEPGVVKFFYDGAQVGELSSPQLNGFPQYLIAGFGYPTTSCCGQPSVVPDEMTINYVRVWQHPTPPEATTGGATNIQELQATLSGTVNPHGAATNYYFQYGPTNKYGASTPVTGAGSGTGAEGVNATITGLEAGTTYHYRLVATNSYNETTYGADATFSTPGGTAPAAFREPAHGMQWVYYPTDESNIEGLFWNSSAGTWSPFDQWPSAPAVAQGTSAAVLYEEGVGQQWVYYQTAQNRIVGLYWDASAGKWNVFEPVPGAPAARPGTSPTAVRESAVGQQWVYYQTTQGNIVGLYWDASAGTWSLFEPVPGTPAAASGTSPSAVFAADGEMWVYYHTVLGNIEGLAWNAKGSWSAFDMWPEAPAAAPGTSPTVLREPNSPNQQWVYYQTVQGTIDGLYWDASAGKWSVFEPVPGALAAAQGTGPTAVYDATYGQMWVYYHTAQGNIEGLFWNAKGSWSAFDMWPEAPAAASWTSPTVIREAASPYQQWVYYQAAAGNIEGLYWDASAGKWQAFDQWPGAPPA